MEAQVPHGLREGWARPKVNRAGEDSPASFQPRAAQTPTGEGAVPCQAHSSPETFSHLTIVHGMATAAHPDPGSLLLSQPPRNPILDPGGAPCTAEPQRAFLTATLHVIPPLPGLGERHYHEGLRQGHQQCLESPPHA